MRKLTICLLLCCLVTGVSGVAAEDPDPARKQRADEVLKQRLAYAGSAEFNPYSPEPEEALARIDKAFELKDYAEVLKQADIGLKASRFNIRLLMAKAAAYGELKNEQKEKEVSQQWMAVADSIVNYGDGRSFKTAFKVINIDEEYALLSLFGCKPDSQRLMSDSGSQYDVMDVTHIRSGKKYTLYFNVDIPMGYLKKLGPDRTIP